MEDSPEERRGDHPGATPADRPAEERDFPPSIAPPAGPVLPPPRLIAAPPLPVFHPAGFIRRAIAFILDFMILGFLYLILALAGFWGLRLSNPVLSPSQPPLPLAVPFAVAWVFLYFGYFTFFHANSGQTPAKMIIRIKVVSAEGEGRLSVGRSLFRSFCYFLSSLFFGFGFFLAAFEKQKRGLHDLLADTRVILSP